MNMRSPLTANRLSTGRIALVVILSIGGLILLLPLVWMVSSSLKPEFDIFVLPP